MPELPEVETVLRALKPHLIGSTIEEVKVRCPTLRLPVPQDLIKLLPLRKIIDIKRRAKYLLFELTDGLTLLVHFGMTGKLIIRRKAYIPAKHDHIVVSLDDKILVYNDARRFGLIDLIATSHLPHHKLFGNLGPEPLDASFTPEYLREILKSRQGPIKTAIMDNKIVVGVGNIYANEVLFWASISPRKKANALSQHEYARLVDTIKRVLQNAITFGGSSIKDFVSIDNKVGKYQSRFAVYGKAGKACQVCGSLITRIYQGGRATFFCPTCQDV